MSTLISVNELKESDVLLYQGDSFISRMIRLFDGGDYSHAGVFSGGNVLEAIGSGIEYRSVVKSTYDVPYIDVYRYKSKDNITIGSEELPYQPVVERVEYYRENWERYGYEQILLLATLTATRMLPFRIIPGLSRILRNVLESAADVLATLVADGKEPMICSELAYRCYEEAGDNYRILIVGADILKGMLHPLTEKQELESESLTAEEKGEIAILRAEAQSFLVTYESVKRKQIVGHEADEIKALFEANANYVTPRDLQKSPNLEKIGRLKI